VNAKVNMMLVWILSWAALSIIIIYSPIGSPDLYEKKNYSIQYQGVDFSAGITNSPSFEKYKHNQQYQPYENPAYAIPIYTPDNKSYSFKSKDITAATLVETNYKVYPISSDRKVVKQKENRYIENFVYIGMRGKTSRSYYALGNQDIASLNTDLTVGNPTARQFASEGALDGGTDPGSDPTGPPIPVGDGFWFLLVLVISYSCLKIIWGLKRDKKKCLKV